MNRYIGLTLLAVGVLLFWYLSIAAGVAQAAANWHIRDRSESQ